MGTETIQSIGKASKDVKTFIEGNKYLPELITINGLQVNRATYLRMACASVIELTKPTQLTILTDTYPNPVQKSDNVTENAQLMKQDYIKLATEINTFIKGNKKCPELYTTRYGQLSFYGVICTFSRVLAYYYENNVLPNYVVLYNMFKATNTITPVPDNFKQYLIATNNCQVNDPTIQSVAGKLSNAQAIFNYILGLTYDYYYNTKRGAVKTIRDGIGNCTDLSHALIALARAKGIPARYVHNSSVVFPSITTGHVWVELYINGAWIKADASNNSNTFGVNPKDSQLQGTTKRYAELPF